MRRISLEAPCLVKRCEVSVGLVKSYKVILLEPLAAPVCPHVGDERPLVRCEIADGGVKRRQPCVAGTDDDD
ncbi:MAG: hypothetical protein AAGC55_33845, partial [Myxococcota bacterium]